MDNLEKSVPNLSLSFNKIDPSFSIREIEKPDYYLILMVKQVSGSYSIDFIQYSFQPNSIIIISKNQNAQFHFEGDDQQFIALTFMADLVKNSDEKVLKMLSFCIREHYEGKQVLKIGDADFKYLEKLSEQLYDINVNLPEEIKTASCFHFLQLILIYCANLYSRQSADLVQGYTQVVGDFTTLLESNFRNTQKVNFYTDTLNLTYNSLARYTSNYCNKTPKEIITERLVLEIKRLLAGTKTPIKEISYHLGFDEPTNMVKYFKKFTGITPSEFRQQSKNYHSL
ncbi:helix-turn-helix domain-containing protein [Desertivirga brevis]|uniref:helix-turn-helix domain-containing protein n=1 Tax=Desertivirga brevis TaxID=2810310 RepID=UPI001A97CA30|nr:helix-turn-helix domain-containing protein [Pedobacter sp. SYSU D00873]